MNDIGFQIFELRCDSRLAMIYHKIMKRCSFFNMIFSVCVVIGSITWMALDEVGIQQVVFLAVWSAIVVWAFFSYMIHDSLFNKFELNNRHATTLHQGYQFRGKGNPPLPADPEKYFNDYSLLREKFIDLQGQRPGSWSLVNSIAEEVNSKYFGEEVCKKAELQ